MQSKKTLGFGSSDMKKPLKFIVSGPGLIGKKHIQLLQTNPACQLVAIVGPSTQDNVEYSTKLGLPLHDFLEQALATTAADGVILSSPNACHYEQACTCINSGIPVLIEKPITARIDDALSLAQMVEISKVPVLVGHHRAYSHLLQAATDFIRSKSFGKIVAVQGSALFFKPQHYFDESPWRTRQGGGPLLINMIHEVGLMRHFYGEISRVFAQASNHIRGYDVEDTVSISLSFENGALGSFLLSDTVASSKSWEMTSGENSKYPHYPSEYCYHFAGTKGSIDFPSMQIRYYENSERASWWEPFDCNRLKTQPDDPMRRQLEHFIKVICRSEEPLVSAYDGFMNMLVLEGIRQSILSDSPVSISSLKNELINK